MGNLVIIMLSVASIATGGLLLCGILLCNCAVTTATAQHTYLRCVAQGFILILVSAILLANMEKIFIIPTGCKCTDPPKCECKQGECGCSDCPSATAKEVK